MQKDYTDPYFDELLQDMPRLWATIITLIIGWPALWFCLGYILGGGGDFVPQGEY